MNLIKFVQEYFDKLSRLMIDAMVLIVPLIIWNGHTTAIEIKDFVIQFLIVLLLMITLLKMLFLPNIVIKLNKIDFWIIAYAILISISYFRSNGTSLNYKAYLPQITGIAFYYFMRIYVKPIHLKNILIIVGITASICSIYGILQFFNIDPLVWDPSKTTPRSVSTFGHKNYFGMFLILTLPINIYALIIVKGIKYKAFFAFSTITSYLALMVSYSRGSLIVFTVLGVFIPIIFLNKLRDIFSFNSRIMIVLKLLPLLLVVAAIATPTEIKDNIKKIITEKQYQTKIDIFKSSLEVVSKNPIFGVGNGNFIISHVKNIYHKFNTQQPTQLLDHCENEYLEIILESGIFALIAYLVIVIILLFRLFKVGKKSNCREKVILSILLFWGLLSFWLYSLVTIAPRFNSSSIFLWMLIALYIILVENESIKIINLNNIIAANRTLTGLCALIIIFSALLLGIRISSTCLSDHYIELANRDSNVKNKIHYLNKAVKLQKKSIEAIYQRGYLEFQLHEVEKSLKDFQKIEKIAPNYIDVNHNMASCYYKMDLLDEANQYLLKSVSLYPDHLNSIKLLSFVSFKQRKYTNAMVYCNQYLQQRPDDKNIIELRNHLIAINDTNNK
jgi:putative inorganic carbon (hco3(-)) transporter